MWQSIVGSLYAKCDGFLCKGSHDRSQAWQAAVPPQLLQRATNYALLQLLQKKIALLPWTSARLTHGVKRWTIQR